MIARDLAIMIIERSVTPFPVVISTTADIGFRKQPMDRQLRLLLNHNDSIDNSIAQIRFHPADQISPFFFFDFISSVVTYAMMPSFFYGGLEVMEGRSEFLYTPTVNLHLSGEFLRQISRSEPDAEHVVVWDGAGFHQKKDLEGLPENIHLIALPPYSPELNPIEQLWDQVAVAYANRVYETLEEIEEDITEALRPFWESPKPTLSLLGADNYLLVSANAS